MPLRKSAFALLLAIPIFVYIVYPLGAMLSESVTLPVADFRAKQMGWDPQHQPSGAGLLRVLEEPMTRAAVWGTLKLSVLSAVTAGAWGLALALLWSRREFPGRRFFAALGLTPVLMPPIVGTLAFYSLAGETGLLWRAMPWAKAWVTPFLRVLLVHTYSFGCYTFAYVSAALEDADNSREQAALSLGAGRVKTFFAATWPVVRGPLLAAALLTFMASAASFSAPYMLDNSSRYLTVEIYNEMADPGMQRSFSVVLAAMALLALPVFLVFAPRGGVELGIKGDVRRGLPRAKPRQVRWRLALSVIAAIPLLLPPIIVVAGVFTNPIEMPYSGIVGAFVIGPDDLAPLGRSLRYGAVVAVFDVCFAAAIAAALKKAHRLAALPVEFGVMLALALPGSSVAISLLSAFNAPSPVAFGAALGGTQTILILAYIIRTLPLAVRPARAAFDALGTELDLAANGLGAKRGRAFFKITLPLVFPSLLAGGLLCFITATGEFVASLLLATTTTQPLSVRMNEVWRWEARKVHMLAVCLMAVCGAVALALRMAGAWRWKSSDVAAAAIRDK